VATGTVPSLNGPAEEATIELSFRQRIWVLIAVLGLGLAALLALEPIPQDPAYHHFADTRAVLGIPNFNDVTSNLGFALVGALALFMLAGGRGRGIFDRPPDVRPYLVFFLGVALVALGSAYYHWAPSNERLLWDRLPMSVAFMAFCAAVVADRIDARAGNGWLLALLVALGLASLFYWHWSESLGRGDLRFYGFVQFYPAVALPVAFWQFPEHRYTAGRAIAWMVAWYGLSKVFEHFDGAIFELLGRTVSGHTLKHLAAAVAPFVLLRMLLARRPAKGPAKA